MLSPDGTGNPQESLRAPLAAFLICSCLISGESQLRNDVAFGREGGKTGTVAMNIYVEILVLVLE